jgi:hypothetical protein
VDEYKYAKAWPLSEPGVLEAKKTNRNPERLNVPYLRYQSCCFRMVLVPVSFASLILREVSTTVTGRFFENPESIVIDQWMFLTNRMEGDLWNINLSLI